MPRRYVPPFLKFCVHICVYRIVFLRFYFIKRMIMQICCIFVVFLLLFFASNFNKLSGLYLLTLPSIYVRLMIIVHRRTCGRTHKVEKVSGALGFLYRAFFYDTERKEGIKNEKPDSVVRSLYLR